MDLNRLRDIVRSGQKREPRRELVYEPVDAPAGTGGVDAAEGLGGYPVHDESGAYLIVERHYPADARHGDVFVGDFGVQADEDFGLLAGRTLADGEARDRVMFVDLETTGLSGGAGTYAFLVGCGWFDGNGFRIRQYFMPGFGGEHALLAAVADWLGASDAIVTYNGKSFDVPVMETRWAFHRMPSSLDDKLHLDMLHAARRFWRGRGRHGLRVLDTFEESCSLVSLERALFGVVRDGDVPGVEIPHRYFHFVRSGDVEPLLPVLEHNRLDLLSLAILTARALRLVREGPDGCGNPGEMFALGRLYESAGRWAKAEQAYARAAGFTDAAAPDRATAMVFPDTGSGQQDAGVVAEALRRVALLNRRQRRFERAAVAWQLVVDLPEAPESVLREAVEALAIHHEHRARSLRSLDVARDLVLGALCRERNPRHQEAMAHRVARLERKLSARQRRPPSLPIER